MAQGAVRFPRFAIAFGAALLGCASTSDDSRLADGHPRDASTDRVDATLAPEEMTVNVTLWPFWETLVSADGWGVTKPLGGVELCVVKRRPYNGKWSDFVDTQALCTTSVAGEPVALKGVPGNSELVLSATKEGYHPQARPLTTGEVDIDVTTGLGSIYSPDDYANRLFASAAPEIVGTPDAGGFELGDLTVYSFVCTAWVRGLPECAWLGGAQVTLRDPAGAAAPIATQGAFYFRAGKVVGGARATVPGDIFATDGGASMPNTPGAAFTNLAPGEYEVVVDDPAAFCAINDTTAAAVWGFARQGGAILAPVLAGHTTTPIVARCQCRNSTDRYWCGAGDGGVR